ncbi:MAG: hypothetical protein OEW11_01690 [Nitrospirota bacterium]|nr:hypothetical protein [Nitrospirota bacterium]
MTTIELNMSDEFRAGCQRMGVTEEMLAAALRRSDLSPEELLSIDTTTSARNFRVAYRNKAGEKKWAHLFMVTEAARHQ